MKRQLRASGQVVAPISSSSSSGSESDGSHPSSRSHKGKQRAQNPEVVSAHQTTRAHVDQLAEVNARLEALVRRGREAVQRVEGMTSGGKGKVLNTWDQIDDDDDDVDVGDQRDRRHGDDAVAGEGGSEKGAGDEEGPVD